jgi:hypothetical protein
MKKYYFLAIILFAAQFSVAQIDYNKLKKQGQSIVKQVNAGNNPLSNDEIIEGLKEALTVGSNNASKTAAAVDGYYKNPKLYIPFPSEAKKMEQKLRSFGQEKLVNDFLLSLNRAAEDAAKEAAPIFVNAVKSMSIADGLSILKGNDDAATQYLKQNTQALLVEKFKPIVENSLQKVSATKYWEQLVLVYNKIPMVEKMNPNLSEYATQKAIDGIFIVVAEEELQIRKNPAARVSAILKKVFNR